MRADWAQRICDKFGRHRRDVGHRTWVGLLWTAFGCSEEVANNRIWDVPEWVREADFDSTISAYSYQFNNGTSTPAYVGPATCETVPAACTIPSSDGSCVKGVVMTIRPANLWMDMEVRISAGSMYGSGEYLTRHRYNYLTFGHCTPKCGTSEEDPTWEMVWHYSSGLMVSSDDCQLEVVDLLDTPRKSICVRRERCFVQQSALDAKDFFYIQFAACCSVGDW